MVKTAKTVTRTPTAASVIATSGASSNKYIVTVLKLKELFNRLITRIFLLFIKNIVITKLINITKLIKANSNIFIVLGKCRRKSLLYSNFV